MYRRLRLVVLLGIQLSYAPWVWGIDFSTLGDGNWNAPATWTPSGTPGSLDTASIGSTTPGFAATVATVTVTTDETVRDVVLGRGRDTMGTLILQGVLTVTGSVRVGQINGIGQIEHLGGRLETDGLNVTLGNTITLSAADRVNVLEISSLGRVITNGAANLGQRVSVLEAGSTLELGAPLTLTEDLDIRGLGGTPAVVQRQRASHHGSRYLYRPWRQPWRPPE